MVEVQLKPNPNKPGYYILHEIPGERSEAGGTRFNVRSHVWRPPTDVFETEEGIIVRVEIAGMQEADFSILLDGSTLIVRGSRQDMPEKRAYHQMEIRFGEFVSEIELSQAIAIEKVEASYQNGFLRVFLPKARPLRIRVD